MCLCFWCSKTEIWPDRFISYRRALFLWFRWWIAEHSTHTRQKTVHLNIRRKCNKSSGSPVWWHKTTNNRKSSRNLHLLLITFFVGDVQCLGYKAKLAPSEKLHQQFWWQSKQTWNVFLWVFMYSENAFALTLWSLYLVSSSLRFSNHLLLLIFTRNSLRVKHLSECGFPNARIKFGKKSSCI